jgi:hypothetical protein
VGTYGRPEIWDHRATPPGGQPPVWRQGAWVIDGDPTNQKGSGFVTYGCNALSLGPDALQGGMGFYTPNSFGELNIIPGVAGGNTFYLCGWEDGSADAPFGLDGFVVRDNNANDLFAVQRAGGKITASIPFILMTGLADNAGMRHGMELGSDDYLLKPFTGFVVVV